MSHPWENVRGGLPEGLNGRPYVPNFLKGYDRDSEFPLGPSPLVAQEVALMRLRYRSYLVTSTVATTTTGVDE